MRFAVEAWAPGYGAPVDGEQLEVPGDPVDIHIEVPGGSWSPLRPDPSTAAPETILFVDGVQRIDAIVWIDAADGRTRPGLCGSYAAGVVRCDGRARIEAAEVERGLFSPAPEAESISTPHGRWPVRTAVGESATRLRLALQERMGELERRLAEGAAPADLIVVDGPLLGRQHVPGAIGYVKSHEREYLPPEVEDTVARLGVGERTPLFVIPGGWTRYSWYLRLPGASGHRWAGVVRCEASVNRERKEAIALADRTAAVLPRFASRAHKDPRAPQNLYPIAGLERELRRRLGDAELLYRALRAEAVAARRGAAAPPA